MHLHMDVTDDCMRYAVAEDRLPQSSVCRIVINVKVPGKLLSAIYIGNPRETKKRYKMSDWRNGRRWVSVQVLTSTWCKANRPCHISWHKCRLRIVVCKSRTKKYVSSRQRGLRSWMQYWQRWIVFSTKKDTILAWILLNHTTEGTTTAAICFNHGEERTCGVLVRHSEMDIIAAPKA